MPNEKLITERIENLSLADRGAADHWTCRWPSSDTDLVQRELTAAALDSGDVLKEPAPAVRLVRLGADGLEFQLLFWVTTNARQLAVVGREPGVLRSGCAPRGSTSPTRSGWCTWSARVAGSSPAQVADDTGVGLGRRRRVVAAP